MTISIRFEYSGIGNTTFTRGRMRWEKHHETLDAFLKGFEYYVMRLKNGSITNNKNVGGNVAGTLKSSNR